MARKPSQIPNVPAVSPTDLKEETEARVMRSPRRLPTPIEEQHGKQDEKQDEKQNEKQQNEAERAEAAARRAEAAAARATVLANLLLLQRRR